jgi:hypothetical protein
MKNSQFERWWKRISALDSSLLNHPSLPLAGMEEVSGWFNIPALTLQPAPTSPKSRPALPQPAFKNLSDDVLLTLRLNLAGDDETSQWAEKMMRYCEIFYSSLKQKSIDKCGDLPKARLHLLQLTVFLFEYYRYAKDLRFLNIALKLGDLGWLVSPSLVESGLDKGGEEALAALFGANVLMSLEQALGELETGEPSHA